MMVAYERHITLSTPASAAVLTAAACLSAYILVRPALAPPKPKINPAAARAPSSKTVVTADFDKIPYPADTFPGGRDVVTPYGSMRVYEWGPEEGDKVVIMHGIGTPCIAMGDMARQFVSKGNRVMVFDFFGRGYSQAPTDMPYDDRLYSAQLLHAIASSPISWTGPSAFHVVGYSLGGAIAASFAAYHPNLVRSLTLVCPGGLVRTSHVSTRTRLLYSEGTFPERALHWLLRRRLEPGHVLGGSSADVPDGEETDVDFDSVRLSRGDGLTTTVGDVIRWQLKENEGFVRAYMSTIRNAPVYGQHEGVWKLLAAELAKRRESEADIAEMVPPGLEGGKVCLILGQRDPIVVATEWMEDSKAVLGKDGVVTHVVKGGHEIAITKGKEVADLAMTTWAKNVAH